MSNDREWLEELTGIIVKAVAGERERCAQIAFDNQHLHAQFIGQKILKPVPEPPESPPPAPMTIETVMVKLRYNIPSTPKFWGEVETWLTRLVQAQARRDAEIIDERICVLREANTLTAEEGCAYQWAKRCRMAILKSAGLE